MVLLFVLRYRVRGRPQTDFYLILWEGGVVASWLAGRGVNPAALNLQSGVDCHTLWNRWPESFRQLHRTFCLTSEGGGDNKELDENVSAVLSWIEKLISLLSPPHLYSQLQSIFSNFACCIFFFLPLIETNFSFSPVSHYIPADLLTIGAQSLYYFHPFNFFLPPPLHLHVADPSHAPMCDRPIGFLCKRFLCVI